jgi:pimeloyl-ACP methyl ester carboxylesterase
MDSKFLEMAKSATAGSSRIRPIIDQPDRTRVRTSSQRSTLDVSPIVRLRLTDDEGFLEWEETTGEPPDLGRFRSPQATPTPPECEAFELEFERLPPSKITQFLCRRDQKLTPHRGLRRYDPESNTLRETTFPDQGDALVFVHGTFSNSENMLAGLIDGENQRGNEFLKEAARRYRGNLFTFDHPTLSVGPILNAFDLQRAIGRSAANLHLVSHSRGGLVSRWWCETFDPTAERCEKSIFVGTPLAGTGLAAPPNIRETIHLLTQISRALQAAAGLTAVAVPVFSVVEALLRVVTSITGLASRTPVVDAAMAMIPGLFAMSRVGNNPELQCLRQTPQPQTERYFAVESDFQPGDPSWKFWKLFRTERIADAGADALFDGANDLVVDTPSMIDLASMRTIPRSRRLDFGQSPTVHHLNYFYQPETANFLGQVLL